MNINLSYLVMKVAMAKLNYIRILLIAGIICLSCFGGCSESANSAKNRRLSPDYSNVEFEKVSEPLPTAKTLYVMANILASQGRDAEREVVMKRIIREYPDFFPVYNSLAELQLRQGRKKEAIETMQAGLRIRPEDATLLNNIGMCRLICMEYEKALEMFTKAAGLMPQNVRYRANMAVTLSLMGHYDESLSLFRQILPPEDADYNVNAIRKTKISEASLLQEEDIDDTMIDEILKELDKI